MLTGWSQLQPNDPGERSKPTSIPFVRAQANLRRNGVFHGPGLIMRSSADCAVQLPSGTAIAWEGRLDNRRELRSRFGLSGEDDARTVLGAFEQSGGAALGEVIGDWSAVIWDAGRSCIVLASDYIGVRPLYYHFDGATLRWSSSLRQVVDDLPHVPEIDADYIADFLDHGESSTRTPYHGIRVVPPGHAVRVSSAGMDVRALWRPPITPIRFRDQRDYALRCRELFEEAVAVRLQAAGPIYAELSGGLDSSAVVSMAQKLISEGRVNGTHLTVLHYRDDASSDQPFYRLLLDALALDSECIDARAYPFLSEETSAESAPLAWASRWAHLAARATRRGACALLTGRMGDLIMGNYLDDSEQVADHLQRFSLGKAASEALAWSRILHVPALSVLARAFRLTCRPHWERGTLETSLTRNFAVGGDDAIRSNWNSRKGAVSTKKHQRLLAAVIASRSLQTPPPVHGVLSYTHPYTHRPLVEYMLAIPSSVVCGPGQPRKLMRLALADLLPRAILDRRSKASFQKVLRASLEPVAASLVRGPQDIRVVSRGWVNAASLASRLDRFLKGIECNESQLRQIILLELWLRRFEGSCATNAAAV